jgi:hypothetical protein
VWVIRHKDDSGSAILLTRPVRGNDVVAKTRLVFNRYDDLHFLSEFWIVGTQTGHEIPISKRERALEKTLAERRQQQILIDRGQ